MNEVNTLAHQIAFQAAKTIIEGNTVKARSDGEEWRDIDTEMQGEPLGLFLKPEIRYLTLRGALVWCRLKPNLVRIVDPGKIGGRA